MWISSLRGYELPNKRLIASIFLALSIVAAGIYKAENHRAAATPASAAIVVVAGDTGGFSGADDLPLLDSPRTSTSSEDSEEDPEKIREQFYAQFLEERGEEVREATFNDLIAKFDASEFAPRYRLLDLNVSSDNSEDAVRKYANAFARILNKHSGFQFRKVELTLGDAFEKKDPALLNDLQKPSIAYRNLSADLRALPVPSSFADEHLKIINAQDIIARALAALLYAFDDPIRGTGAYQAYILNKIELRLSHMRSIVAFSKHGVKFYPNELAYFYFKIPTVEDTSSTTEVSTP